MSQIARKQDLPPPGGYKPIPFERVKAKSLFSGIAMIGGFAVFNSFTFYIYACGHRVIRREQIEMRSGTMALYPLLLAERDRQFLSQVRRNRDAEAELMKDVEGWEVGTLFGEPVFKTLPKDKFITPVSDEYYVHASVKGARKYNDSWLRS